MKLIDTETLRLALASGRPPVLAEALPENYWSDWRLPGARHLPHDRVRELAAAVLPEKSAPVVVYCASKTCQNSHIAARLLEQLGYADVSVYPGGKEEWSQAGLPVERGQPIAV
jgi:rhodanese-related sulfurtransferase